jgi:hypothetical protein
MTMERSTRTRLTTGLILVMVLATGLALGMAVGPRVLSSSPAGDVEGRRSGEDRTERGREGPQRRRPLVVEQVGLSEEQKTLVDSIVSHQMDRMRALQEEFDRAYMPRYGAIIGETREAIRQVLTLEQRTAYDSLLAEHDRRRQGRRAQDSISDSRR